MLCSVDTLRIGLFVIGYPLAIVVIARFVPVVKQRRIRWMMAHHVGVVAIIIGLALSGDWIPVAVNSSWLLASTLWYAQGQQRKQLVSSSSGS